MYAIGVKFMAPKKKTLVCYHLSVYFSFNCFILIANLDKEETSVQQAIYFPSHKRKKKKKGVQQAIYVLDRTAQDMWMW